MVRRVAFPAIAALLLAALNGCALNLFNFERREAWRGAAEAACMDQRPFRRDAHIVEARAINDHGVCGMEQPLRVSAMLDGSVVIGPTATLGCPVTLATERWLAEAVQPAAVARLGSPVVRIHQMSSYACRTRNNAPGAELSEHAFGNALDIGAFELADGRVVSVLEDWGRGTQEEKDFLREAHATACNYFTTVLGPGVANHADHFHLDLAHHNAAGTSRYCRPETTVPPPTERPFLNFPMALAQPDPTTTSSVDAALDALIADVLGH
ncbi:MAG: extensin family protein [Bauldia sp.]|nr:extensin family protein [Bauldia sp.]